MSSTAARSTVRTAANPQQREGGFTMIELMIVIALMAILLAVAVPSFRDLIQRNRVAGEINSFVSDLQFARSEAIKRGQPVSLCPSANGSSCLGTNTWHQGWIVFFDANGSGTVGGGDTVLRVRAGWASGDTFVANPSLTSLTYGRDGFAANLAAGTLTMPLRTSPVNNNATRCLTLNIVGRQTVQLPGVGSCT